jgi:preprotein translocase subunit SecG
MQTLILVLHILVCIAIIVLVLLQHGKGADVGATFGSGGSQTMFGSAGSMSFFMKLTGILALIFFENRLVLSYLASHQTNENQFLQIPKSMNPANPSSIPNSNNPPN